LWDSQWKASLRRFAATRTGRQIAAAGSEQETARACQSGAAGRTKHRMWRADAGLGRAKADGRRAAWGDQEECWAANAAADKGASCGGRLEESVTWNGGSVGGSAGGE
jgi:hypothetical protein